MRVIVTILMACALAAGASAGPSLEQDAKDFLARFGELGDAYDPAIADLYTDDAVVKAFRRYPHGLERAVEMPGVAWKEMIQRFMPLAKAQNDRSEFREPEFEVDGDRVRIKADRYSFRKCYLDTGYYMIVQKQPDGSLRIVEEYSETQPQSDC
jgi:hypothetical protein